MNLHHSPSLSPMVRARKRFGQHFLEPAWVRKVVDAIAPRPGEAFLEIGPGRGALTLGLAARGAYIVAVEIDRDLTERLAAAVPPSVRIVEADVLRADLEGLVEGALADRFDDAAPPSLVRIAGNLPYNISSPLLLRLVDLARRTGRVSDATLMLQEEVADRVTASPGSGNYGPLAIAVQRHADPRRLLALPPGAFRPAPRVRSTLIGLSFRAPREAVADEAAFRDLVRTVFTQRRKILANALAPYASSRGWTAAGALAAARLDGRRRPETLDLAEYARLAATFANRPRSSVL